MENTDSDWGNIVWFGSADGLTPDSNYIHDTFNLTVTMSIHSGSIAGLMFRTGESSTSNNEGPSYFVGLDPSEDLLKWGVMVDGWYLKHLATVTSDYDTAYTLSIHASGSIYNVYLDGALVMENIDGTEFSTGSFGVRTWMAPTTFYSVKYYPMEPSRSSVRSSL